MANSNKMLMLGICCVHIIAVFILIIYFVESHDNKIAIVQSYINALTPRDVNPLYAKLLRERCSSDGVILLTLVDAAFTDMALNFYLTSIKPYGIKNYLFVGASGKSCQKMLDKKVPCITYTEDVSADVPSVYMTEDFIRKMNIRTEMILDALQLGLSVIHTDLDVVFLNNPLKDLNETQADMATLWDSTAHNAGFLIVRPTDAGRWIYSRVRNITSSSKTTDDQSALNTAISECKSYIPPCNVLALPTEKYVCGLTYFEENHHMFAEDDNKCEECLVVHNNWIVSKEAKEYRFKENHMWVVDDGYYSSNQNKYLVYQNPFTFESTEITQKQETEALQNALAIGSILHRIVILPRFHCDLDGKNLCPLNSRFKMIDFDKYYSQKYRENTFLSHPLVPEEIKRSVSRPYLILPQSVPETQLKQIQNHNMTVLRSKLDTGATDYQIKKWFNREKANVLVFHSLNSAFHGYIDKKAQDEYQQILEKAFQLSSYRQL